MIGVKVPGEVYADRQLVLDIYFRVSNLGNRGEPASVYADRTSRFIVIEKARAKRPKDIIRFGFHKFLNANERQLEGALALLGLRKELKPAVARVLRNEFNVPVDKRNQVDVGPIAVDDESQLKNLIYLLLIVGLVKLSFRDDSLGLKFEASLG